VWYRCACVCVDGSSIWYAISLSRDLLYFSFFSFFFNYSFFTLVLTGACHSIHFALVEITARVILSPKWNVSLITTFHSLSISFNRKRSILCIHTYARANISPNDIQRSLSLSVSLVCTNKSKQNVFLCLCIQYLHDGSKPRRLLLQLPRLDLLAIRRERFLRTRHGNTIRTSTLSLGRR